MNVPLWVPTRNEIYGRSLKWAWRVARWVSEALRRAVVRWASRGPVTDREWERFARALERMSEADV